MEVRVGAVKTATVGQVGSQLHGLRAKCCPRKTKAGQVVFWTLTAGKPLASWEERAFVLHATCMAEKIAAAPAGAPCRPEEIQAELDALAAAAAA